MPDTSTPRITPSSLDRTNVRIGDAISRVDGRAKVTGAARYAAEHPVDDLLYGWIVSSAIAHGRVLRVDDSAARRIAGVVEVMTHANRPDTARRDGPYKDQVSVPGSPFRPLYDDEVRFSGQPVALVLAESLELARYAASLVRVDYESAPHNTDLKVGFDTRYEPREKRDTYTAPKSRGDAKGAYATAPLKHEAEYHLPTHHHNPMEMHATTVVWEGDDRITVHDKTQGSQNVQAYLAGIFGFETERVRVLNPYVGGGFGSGLRPQYQVYLATLAAKMTERSVRVVMTRQQMFTHVHRPECVQHIKLGTDVDGRFRAIVNDATTPTSRFEDYMEVICNWGLMNYASPNASGEQTLVAIDTYTPGDMRAPGAATGMTLFELAIDEMAEVAGLDPLAFRRLNDSPIDAMNDKPYTSRALPEAFAQGAARFGWERRTPQPRSMKEGRELIGYGMATGMWDAMFMKTAARCTIRPDGHVEVSSASSDIGTGTYTVMAQVAADTLGVELERITAKLGDSRMATAPVEGGSWGAASTGAAVRLACTSAAGKLLKAADRLDGKPLHGLEPNDVTFAGGRIAHRQDASRSVAIADAMAAAGIELVDVEETAAPGPMDMLSQMKKARNTHSAIFAEVRVDEELGVVRVARIVIAVAAGRIVNPKTARSQILGGVVMGIGMALHEETFSDHKLGRFMNHSLAEYHVTAHADVHDIDVIFVEEVDYEVTPLGIKGLGEIGIVSTAAAVVNAIHHATGKRVRSLPATIDKLL